MTLLVPSQWKSGLGPIRAEPEPSGSPLRVVVRDRVGISHSNVYWLKEFRDVVQEVRPDATYVDEGPEGLAAAQAAQASRVRRGGLVVLAIQNLFKRYPPPFGSLLQYVLSYAHAAVSISDQATEVLRHHGFTGAVLPMPFSTDLTPLTRPEREQVYRAYGLHPPLAGYVGRLVPEKGIDTFLRAIASCAELNAVIVGSGPEETALRRLADELRLGDRITFTGFQTPAETARLLGSLDVLALPSRIRRNWCEQFGRVLIEAMASGVPVVASQSGAIPEVVGDAGILVPVDDFKTLAAGLQRALQPSAAEALRERGLARVCARFTRKVEADGLHRALMIAAGHGASA